jgi:hypothetical protein
MLRKRYQNHTSYDQMIGGRMMDDGPLGSSRL